jgi:hypothetical protein
VVAAQVPPSTFRIRYTLCSRHSLHTRRTRASRSIPHIAPSPRIRRNRESRRSRSPDIRRSLCIRSRNRRHAECWDGTLRRPFCRRHKTSPS